MYYLNDTKSYIKEIQKFLNVYAAREGKVIRVPIDGILGDKTRAAIKSFQKSNSLTDNGVVDKKTYKLLSEIFKSEMLLKSVNKYVITPNGFPLKLHTQGSDAMALNIILEELRNTYKGITKPNRTRYFDIYTEMAVRDIQKILGFEETGEVDALLFDRLKRELYLSNRRKSQAKFK